MLIQDDGGRELDQAVGRHVLEDAEGGDQRCTALSDDGGDAADVGAAGCEGGGDAGLGLGERDAGVGRPQRAAVVSAVTAHT